MLTCNVVRQLLPNYVDRLLDDETKCEVDEHLDGCAACCAEAKALNAALEGDGNGEMHAASKKEIDHLAKLRKRTVGVAALVAVVLMALFMVWMKLFYFGSPVQSSNLEIMPYVGKDANTDYFYLHFKLEGEKDLLVKRTYIEGEDGMYTGVELEPVEVLRNPLDHVGTAFEYGYEIPEDRDFVITVKLADKEIVYHTAEWVDD